MIDKTIAIVNKQTNKQKNSTESIGMVFMNFKWDWCAKLRKLKVFWFAVFKSSVVIISSIYHLNKYKQPTE